MDVAQLVLDYLDSLKWPILVAAVLGVSFTRYRAELGRVLEKLGDRLTAVKTPLGEATFEQPKDLRPPDEAPTLVNAEQNPTQDVEQLAAKFQDDLATVAAQAEQTRTVLEAERTNLTIELAAARLWLFYEQVYRLVFGTQIQLIEHVQRAEPAGSPRNELEAFHRAHLNQNGVIVSFEHFVAFLLSSELILFDPTTQRYRLGQWGAGFLSYLERNVISKYKLM